MIQRHKKLGLSLLALALGFGPLSLAQGADYSIALKLVSLPSPLTIDEKGKVQGDKSKWTIAREKDGTDLFTSKSGVEAKAAAMTSKEGNLQSFTTYALKSGRKTPQPETSSSVFFDEGKLAAFTSCQDEATQDSLGRICVTATPKLCQSLKKSEAITPDVIKEMDSFEMRALAVILTLRGSDHQLDNVIRSGNRLGLKSALQTTKGQLITLARQIVKEAASQNPELAEKLKKDQDARKIANTDEAPQKGKIDPVLARSVLEKSLPRLKQACLDTGFSS